MTAPLLYQELNPRRAAMHRVRGIEYCVHEWGCAEHPLLVLLHGWGDCGATFQFLVDALKSDWYVIAPDWRGFGDSGHNTGAYWFPDYLADLDVLLDIYTPHEPAPLIGHSMGANVISLYAGIRHERVAALVNIEGFGLADSDAEHAPAHYRRWLDALRQAGDHPGYADFDELVPKIRKRSPRMSEGRARFVARQWAGMHADGRIRLKADPAHRWPNAVQYRRAEALACWQRVSAPVLLLRGAETGFSAVAAAWEDSSSNALPFPDARTATVADAGHMLQFEQPERVADELERFLQAVLPAADL